MALSRKALRKVYKEYKSDIIDFLHRGYGNFEFSYMEELKFPLTSLIPIYNRYSLKLDKITHIPTDTVLYFVSYYDPKSQKNWLVAHGILK